MRADNDMTKTVVKRYMMSTVYSQYYMRDLIYCTGLRFYGRLFQTRENASFLEMSGKSRGPQVHLSQGEDQWVGDLPVTMCMGGADLGL